MTNRRSEKLMEFEIPYFLFSQRKMNLINVVKTDQKQELIGKLNNYNLKDEGI